MKTDFLIVGAGTAGCVLADRLSQDGKTGVVVLEAGGRPKSPFVKIPAGFVKLFQSEYDWNFETVPQTNAGRKVFVPRGKMLGGSSNMNAQIHQWGHPADFDGWVAAGAPGWSWRDVVPVFRLQERLNRRSVAGRGTSGKMNVEANANTHPLSRAFVRAAHAAGLPRNAEYNGTEFEGAWIADIAHFKGKRHSAYDAFLAPAMRRRNLRVIERAHVTRITFDGKRATGAEYASSGKLVRVDALKGVILCAGAIGSPQILLCSGVGAADDLRRIGIDVVSHNPGVGRNLHDHPMAGINFAVRRNDTFKSAESLSNLLRYVLFKSGPLASNAAEAIAFTHADGVGAGPPNIEVLITLLEWRKQGLEPPKTHAFVLGCVVLDPVSRGSLTLKSSDTRDAPVIDYNLLGDPEGRDAQVMTAALRLARTIAGTRPLADEVVEEIMPGKSVADGAPLLEAVKRDTLQTVYHPVGSCRMGSDDAAVVTPRLAVRGVEGLWVADASVMPTIIRGHPNAAVAMIAHNAADFVRR